MGKFCLLVDLHREGYAPAACAAGLFILKTPLLLANDGPMLEILMLARCMPAATTDRRPKPKTTQLESHFK